MTKKIVAAFFFLLSLSFMIGCKGSMYTAGSLGTNNSSSTTVTATYSSLYTNVFMPKCLSCHSGNAPSGNYSLASYATTISGGAVVSFNAASSPLYTRVNDNSMPQGGPALSTAEKQAIYNWIQAGAANN